MIDKIFFFHNPKAGGSSLRRIFESRFSGEKRCPIIENDKVEHEGLRGDYVRFRGYDLYAGHYGRDIFVAVNDGHSCVTNFRHPIARLLSLYNYFRYSVNPSDEELRTDRFYAVLTAKSVSLERFVSSGDPRVAVYVRNAHFRQLANSSWSLETAKGLRDVKRLIDGMPWYYICEYPELSVRWMNRVLGWEIEQMPRENVTGDQGGQATSLPVLDDHAYGIICRSNNLDFAIYKYAVDCFLSRTCLPFRPPGWRARIASKMQNAVQMFRNK